MQIGPLGVCSCRANRQRSQLRISVIVCFRHRSLNVRPLTDATVHIIQSHHAFFCLLPWSTKCPLEVLRLLHQQRLMNGIFDMFRPHLNDDKTSAFRGGAGTYNQHGNYTVLSVYTPWATAFWGHCRLFRLATTCWRLLCNDLVLVMEDSNSSALLLMMAIRRL